MRLVFLLLLLVNIALAPFASGLVEYGRRGEPLRMTSQISPERIRILPAPVAMAPAQPDPPAAATEPPAAAMPAAFCRAFAGLSREQADRLAARARELQPGVTLNESEQPGTPSWWVHVADLGSRQLAERKMAELRALGVREMALMPDAEGQRFDISLGLFKTETGARELLARLSGQGVRSARIAEREGRPGRLRVALSGAESEVAALLTGLTSELDGMEPAECP